MKFRCFSLLVLTALALPLVRAAEPEPYNAMAVMVLEKAAASGDANAKFHLGRAYFRGEGVAKDVTKSVAFLQESAELGNADAMDALGYLHLIGAGFPKDEAKAVEWFRKAAEAGSTNGQMNLGLMLRQGKTTPHSNEESLLWLSRSADGGKVESQAILGQIYFSGDKYQPKDIPKAIPYLQKAAEAGNSICQNMLGLAYRDGAGVDKDPAKAEELLRKAAEQNNLKAQSNLGHLLGAGLPGGPNQQEGLMWLLISSEQGEITAKKTCAEILPALPAGVVALARKDADRFLLKHRISRASKPATDGGTLNIKEVSTSEPVNKQQ